MVKFYRNAVKSCISTLLDANSFLMRELTPALLPTIAGVNFIYRLVTTSFHILFPRAPPCVNLSLHSFGPQHVWSFVATAGREKVSLYSEFI